MSAATDRQAKEQGAKRSTKWPTFRKKFLKGKVCAVCGGTKKLELHHILPFHKNAAKELDPDNVIPLCEGNKEINCHLFVGHLGNFKGWNPEVRKDAGAWAHKLAENKIRMKGGRISK